MIGLLDQRIRFEWLKSSTSKIEYNWTFDFKGL